MKYPRLGDETGGELNFVEALFIYRLCCIKSGWRYTVTLTDRTRWDASRHLDDFVGGVNLLTASQRHFYRHVQVVGYT